MAASAADEVSGGRCTFLQQEKKEERGFEGDLKKELKVSEPGHNLCPNTLHFCLKLPSPSSVDQYSSHLHHHQEEDSLSKVTTTSAVSLAFTASASVAFKTFFGVLVHTPSIRNKSTASLLLWFFRRVGNGCLQAHCHNVQQHLLCYHQTQCIIFLNALNAL